MYYDMRHSGTYLQIFNSLGLELRHLALTTAQLCSLVECNPELLDGPSGFTLSALWSGPDEELQVVSMTRKGHNRLLIMSLTNPFVCEASLQRAFLIPVCLT
jgi:hypothetical protein